jgi:hypothetical protein
MDAEAFHRMVNRVSGLLGVSETSPDLRDLLARERDDPRAAEAVDLFCYRVRTQVGALAAALGGLDTLVFAGGIGEHAPEVRRRALSGLEFLGITIDDGRNRADAPVISADDARICRPRDPHRRGTDDRPGHGRRGPDPSRPPGLIAGRGEGQTFGVTTRCRKRALPRSRRSPPSRPT